MHKNILTICEQEVASMAVTNTRALRLEECQQKLSRTKNLQNKWSILYLLNKVSEQNLSVTNNNLSVGPLFQPEALSTFCDKSNKMELEPTIHNNQLLNNQQTIKAGQQQQQNLQLQKVNKREEPAFHQDKQFMRELIFIFQGVQSKYFVFFDNDQKFQINESLCGKVSPSKKQIILKLCELGWLYSRISSILNDNKGSITGLIFQSMCNAIKEELNEYYRLVAIFENLRDNDKKSGNVQALLGNPQTQATQNNNQQQMWNEYDEGKDLSLKKLYLWTLEPLERLKWLAVLTESCKKLTGGKLLSSLYSYSTHGSPQIQDLVQRILRKTLGPFMNFLKMWIYTGELVDPMGEFFIHLNSDVLDDDKFWYEKYSLAVDMIPSFIEYELAEKILVIGKTKTFLRKFCSQYDWNLEVEFIKVEN